MVRLYAILAAFCAMLEGGGMNTRKGFIRDGFGLAAILAAQTAPAILVRSMAAARNGIAAAKSLSAKSYVQGGLIAMWDGIENAGWGVHDMEATTWKDLTGNGYDLELRNSAHFDINSLVTAERNKVSALLDRTLSYRSIEVCGFADESRNSSALVCFGNYLDSGIMFACKLNAIQTYNGNYQIIFTNPVSARSTWSGTHDGSTHVAYVNGDVAVGTMSTNNWSSRAGTFGLSGSSNYSIYNFVGNYYCVRLYSRAITAAEVAANYAVDKARFNLP